MPNRKVTVEIGGDSRGLVRASDEGVRALTRLEAAQKRLMGGKVPAPNFTGLNTLSRQELAEVQRIAREKQKFANQTALQEQKLAAQAEQFKSKLNQQAIQNNQRVELEKQKLQQASFLQEQRLQQQSAQVSARTQAQARASDIRLHEAAERNKLRISEQNERARLRLIENSARARVAAEQSASRAIEAQRRRDFQVEQRQIREAERAQASQIKNRSAAGIGNRLQNIGEGTRNAGYAASAGITAPFVAGATATLTAGVEYEKALNTFEAATKATADEMKRAATVARALGADISLPATSAKDAAVAMTVLGKAGLSASEAIGATRGTLQLAAAGELAVADAANIAASALNAFKLPASDAGRVADILAASSSAAQGSVGDMAAGFQQASAVFNSAKFSIEDMATAISLMAKNGINASDAGTSLRTFVQRLTAPTDVAADSMKKLGVQIFDAQGKMRGLPDIIGQFEKAISGLTDQDKAAAFQNIFGADAIRAAEILFGAGTKGFAEMEAKIKEIGAAARLSEALTKGLGGAWAAFGSQLETIAIDLFNVTKAPLTEFLKNVATFAGQAGQAFATLSPGVQQFIIAAVAIVAALGPVLVVIGAVVSAIGTLSAALGTIAGFAGFATVGAALSAIAPLILPVVAGLAAIAAGAYALYAAWEANFAGIQQIAQQFSGIINDAFAGLMSVVQPAIDEISSYAVEGFGKLAAYWQSGEGQEIAAAVNIVLQAIVRVVRDGLEVVQQFWASHGAEITLYAREAWNGVKGIIQGAVEVIGGLIRTVAAVIRGDWSAAWSGLGTIVTGAFRIVVGIIQGGAALIAAALRTTFGAIVGLAGFVYEQGTALGNAIGRGLINGMTAFGGGVISAAKNLALSAYNSAKNALGIQSPSKEFFKLGTFLVAGFTGGIESNAPKASAAVKRMADDTVKEMNDALKNFNKIASQTPEQQARANQTEDLSKATSDLREIIRLRNELGENTQNPLPQTMAGVNAELGFLKDKLDRANEAQKAFDKSLESIQDTYDDATEAVRKYNEARRDRLNEQDVKGQEEALQLQEEIELLGVVDKFEQQRIKNTYGLLKLRVALNAEGLGEEEVKELVLIREAQQMLAEPDVKLRIKKEEQAEQQKEVSDAIKKQAEEVQKQIENLTADIADSFSNIFNTFARKGIKAGFTSIVDELKNFGSRLLSQVIDGFSQMLAKKLVGGIFGGAGNSGGQQGGGILSSLLGGLFGGGRTGGTGLNNSNVITNFGSNLNGATGTLATLADGTQALNVNGSSGGGLSSIFGSIGGGTSQGNFLQNLKGLFGGGSPSAGGTGRGAGLAGLFTLGGQGISALSGLTNGGAFGGFLGGIGKGVGIGASIGSIIPGVGTIIGAAIGALVGGIAGLFGGNSQRRRDERARTQYLQEAVAGLSQFDELIRGVRTLRIEPESAIAQGTTLGQQLRTQYLQQASGLKDKKTREIAIRSVSELDFKIAQKMNELRAVTEGAASAIDRRNRIIPEFAGGNYFGGRDDQMRDMKQGIDMRRGYIAGGLPGVDRHLGIFADDEAIINRGHINKINRLAGFDVFERIDLPNYVKRYADGNYFTPTVQPSVSATTYQTVQAQPTQTNSEPSSFKLFINGVIPIEDKIEAYLETEKGKRLQAEVFIENRRKGKV